MFEDIDRLVSYFQRHIGDPLQETVPSIRSVAAMVPMRSPADRGSSGGGGGWGGSQSEGGWKGNSDRFMHQDQVTRYGHGWTCLAYVLLLL